ncbi:MAG: HEAT repeat domain-containing protein [Planctomycetota bacterium]|jgi:hypothetical protein
MRKVLIIALLAPAGLTDTVVLESGLELHGAVTERGDQVVIVLDGRTRSIDRARVKEIRKGVSRHEEFSRRAALLGAGDAAGWYRLALWARANSVARVQEALRRVLEIDADHRAARRELGYERVGGEWLAADDAKRRKGFVLAGGKWMLKAEADRLMRHGLMEQAAVTKGHRRRATEIVQALLDDDPEIRAAAAELLSELPDAALVRPLRRLLYAPHVETRILAVKTLGRIGDRAALPWLIRTSMYDAKREVRDTAFRSLKGFRDTDLLYPYGRALFSNNPLVRVQAAHALAELGDLRGVDLILRRISIGIGESGRANLMVGRQNSYIQDFDVEIAQAAAIGDPIVQTIRDGIILDYKVLGGHGYAYVVEQNRAYAGALKSLTGRDFGEDWKAWREYAAEQDYPRVKLTN